MAMNDTQNDQRLAEALAALGSTARLDIVRALARNDGLDVSTLAQCIGHSVANTSQHLTKLRHAGIVTSRHVGTRVVNQIDPQFSDRLDVLAELLDSTEHSGSRR